MKKVCFLLIFVFVPLLGAFAQQTELVMLKTNQGNIKIEADLKWQALAVRGPVLVSGENVPLSQNDLLQLIAKLVTEHDSLLRAENFTSLFLGRLVEYPWLQTFLMRKAAESNEWQKQRGRPVSREINSWVAELLFTNPVWQSIDSLFGKSGYRLTGLSVEKVLVNDVTKINLATVRDLKGKLPFDAQVWLVLKKENKMGH